MSGHEGATNLYSRGYLGCKDVLEVCMEQIRKQADQCENLEGFITSYSLGGGTGSGFASLLL